jgi:hypothetical protein
LAGPRRIEIEAAPQGGGLSQWLRENTTNRVGLVELTRWDEAKVRPFPIILTGVCEMVWKRIAQAIVLLHMRHGDDAAASWRAMHHGFVSTRQRVQANNGTSHRPSVAHALRR